ncbi:MAG: ligase-associated DNA damage response exonuclease [Parachlamydiaceae bacterium]
MDIPLKVLEKGLFCPPGEFYIDAWKSVPCSIVTHAHGDHAYWGHQLYIATEETIRILQVRLGNIKAQPLRYGQKIKLGNAWVSLHPAGHILGAAQVRIEIGDQVTVISGDYKRAHDATCRPFEVIECDIFVTESTFGLPIYQWASHEEISQQINAWWKENALLARPSLLFAYSLGKAQRLMSLLTHHSGKICLHGAVFSLTKLYKEMGVPLPSFSAVSEFSKGTSFSQDLIIAPPSAIGTPWMKRFPNCRTAFASGWMEVRGTRRRKALDRGFVFSDHADWNALIQTIHETKAKIIFTTHGQTSTLARYLREEKNLDARELKGLEFTQEAED